MKEKVKVMILVVVSTDDVTRALVGLRRLTKQSETYESVIINTPYLVLHHIVLIINHLTGAGEQLE